MVRPSLFAMARLYLRIGNTTFGGGDPTMAALQREMVDRRDWMSNDGHGLAFGLARVTPGTNILAYCAATGWLLHGWFGAVVAVGSVCIPTALIATWFCTVYEQWGRNRYFDAAMSGVIAAAAGMMTASAVSIIQSRGRGLWIARAAAIVGFTLLLRYWNVSPISILLAAAAAGFVMGDNPK